MKGVGLRSHRCASDGDCALLGCSGVIQLQKVSAFQWQVFTLISRRHID